MKATEIREMSLDEMLAKETELKEALFNLRFQHEIGQLENPRTIQQTKHDIARLKTIVREIQLKSEAGN